jgi:hypothetical protein
VYISLTELCFDLGLCAAGNRSMLYVPFVSGCCWCNCYYNPQGNPQHALVVEFWIGQYRSYTNMESYGLAGIELI